MSKSTLKLQVFSSFFIWFLAIKNQIFSSFSEIFLLKSRVSHFGKSSWMSEGNWWAFPVWQKSADRYRVLEAGGGIIRTSLFMSSKNSENWFVKISFFCLAWKSCTLIQSPVKRYCSIKGGVIGSGSPVPRLFLAALSLSCHCWASGSSIICSGLF